MQQQQPHEDEEDDMQLSQHALAALAEFYKEREEHDAKMQALLQRAEDDYDHVQQQQQQELLSMDIFKEDWQYDDATSTELAREAMEQASNKDDVIVCVSAPTAFVQLKALGCENRMFLLEYDDRFAVYGAQFIHYDYNVPTPIRKKDGTPLEKQASVLIVDPPFLSEECMNKTLQTVAYLSKDAAKVIVCTGKVMRQVVMHHPLQLKETTFAPKHKNQLSNEFGCYINYPSKRWECI